MIKILLTIVFILCAIGISIVCYLCYVGQEPILNGVEELIYLAALSYISYIFYTLSKC